MPGENVQFNLLLIIFTIFRSGQIVFQGRNGESERAVHTLESCQFYLWGKEGLIQAQWTWERQVVITWYSDLAVCNQCTFVLGMGVFEVGTRWAAARNISFRQGWVSRTWRNHHLEVVERSLETDPAVACFALAMSGTVGTTAKCTTNQTWTWYKWLQRRKLKITFQEDFLPEGNYKC